MQGSNGDNDIEKRLVDMGLGEVGRYGERNMETYTTICEIESQQEFAV